MKKVLNKLFFPSKLIGFFIFNISFGMLIYVFSFHLEGTILAYISYPLSTYALVLFCVWFYKTCQFSNEKLKKTKIYKLYEQYFFQVSKLSIIASLMINFCYFIFNLSVGIYYKSYWFITFALYYLILIIMRYILIHNTKELGLSGKREYKKLKNTGYILLLLNIILIVLMVLIIRENKTITYSGVIIYAVALYDFYLIINAFINVFKYRKKNTPILLSSKCINLTVAMISMISLAVAMISQFGEKDLQFKRIMTSYMGFGICLINSLMAIIMIIRANKNIKK